MDLQLTLIIIGSICIIGLLIHGLWVSRKNNTPQEHWSKDDIDYDAPNIGVDSDASANQTPSFNDDILAENIDLPDPFNEDFDEYGLGKVSIKMSDNSAVENNNTVAASLDLDDIPSFDANTPVAKPTMDPVTEEEPTVYASVVSNPKPVTVTPSPAKLDTLTTTTEQDEFPSPPKHFLQNPDVSAETSTDNAELQESLTPAPRTQESPIQESPNQDSAIQDSATPQANSEQLAQDSLTNDTPLYTAPEVTPPPVEPPPVAKKPSLTEQAKNLVIRKQRRTSVRTEPKINDDQMRIDFDTVDPVINENKAAAQAQTSAPAEHTMEPEFLSLNVKVSKENPISGAQLIASLLTLGFKFGESDIFHRHVNSNGKGPILFSLANMFKPGVFVVENMETEEYYGLSLFMSLPIEGDAHQVFNMMHNAARKLADEFGAQVLDEHRSGLTQQGLQHYVERIREFERRRLFGQ